MKLSDFKRWLEPLDDDYEILIYNGEKEIAFSPGLDIDFNHTTKKILIDGHRGIDGSSEHHL